MNKLALSFGIAVAEWRFGSADPDMSETELKFGLTTESVASLRAAIERGDAFETRLRAIYFDTLDDRLARHGASLRLRKEGSQWLQTAKAKTDRSAKRLEDNVPVSVPPGRRAPVLDRSRHHGTAAGAALAKILGADDRDVDAPDLVERFRTDVSRLSRTVRLGDAEIELALDLGRISAGPQMLPIREFELELKAGPVGALFATAKEWSQAHGLWLSLVSKGARGTRLAAGEPMAPPVKASLPERASAADGAGFFAATLESCLAQVLANQSAVAAGERDDEIVHQLRVGLRRLRTALRELGDLQAPEGASADGSARESADAGEPAREKVLQGVFHELGEHRDQSIVVPEIRRRLDEAGAPPFPDEASTQQPRPLEAIARDAALQQVLLDVFGLQSTASSRKEGKTGSTGKAPRQLIVHRLERLRRKVEHDGKRFATLDTPQRHRVRKRLKRLRYLSEFATPIFGKARVGRYLECWREAQDALGAFNDERIAAAAFRGLAESGRAPGAWFAVGWLAATQDASVRRCQHALARAAAARPFWKGAA